MSRDPVRKVTEVADRVEWTRAAIRLSLPRTGPYASVHGESRYIDAHDLRVLADMFLAAAEVLEARKES